jgi:hypothetical protein
MDSSGVPSVQLTKKNSSQTNMRDKIDSPGRSGCASASSNRHRRDPNKVLM